MFSRTRVLGPRLTMFCLAFLLANCGPEESADTLHCIDNYVINAKLGETPIVPNLCSGATTALEQLWDPAKYALDDVVSSSPNMNVVPANVGGRTQLQIKQGMDKNETASVTLKVRKPKSSCTVLGVTAECTAVVTFSVIFSKNGGLSVTIDGTPPSGIIPPTMAMVTLQAVPTGATAPSYRWERTRLVQSSPATFEMVGTDKDITAAGLLGQPYFYRVVVTDGGRDALAGTVLRPQAFDVGMNLVDFGTYPGTAFSLSVTAPKDEVNYVAVMQQATDCGGTSVEPQDFATISASPDLQLTCSWSEIVRFPSVGSVAAGTEWAVGSGALGMNHQEGLFRVVVTAQSNGGDQVQLDRAFFRLY